MDHLSYASNQPELGHGKLQRLQVRMYLARSRATLLEGRLERAWEQAGQALRKSGEAGDRHARYLPALNAAWIHLQRGRPDAALAAVKPIGGPNDPRPLTLRAAANLIRGDLAPP